MSIAKALYLPGSFLCYEVYICGIKDNWNYKSQLDVDSQSSVTWNFNVSAVRTGGKTEGGIVEKEQL